MSPAQARVTFVVPNARRLWALDHFLICDIDGTLLGDDLASAELCALLARLRSRVGFGVATGRNVDSALAALDETGLPRPDVLATSVGTEIYYGDPHCPDLQYRERQRHGWQRQRLRAVLSTCRKLFPQAPRFQLERKLSYLVAGGASTVDRVRVLLDEAGLGCTLVFSHGRNLDVLPRQASKGQAVRFIARRLGLPLARFVVAGDSGNDADMLQCGASAVVVANHFRELAPLRGRPNVHFSPWPFARGVIDGVNHYGLLTRTAEPDSLERCALAS